MFSGFLQPVLMPAPYQERETERGSGFESVVDPFQGKGVIKAYPNTG